VIFVGLTDRAIGVKQAFAQFVQRRDSTAPIVQLPRCTQA
jgi:hypothetical protein